MKYLKKFTNLSDYETFKVGGKYITPNVSLIADDNSVMFNPMIPPKLITFTVILYGDGFTKIYTAEEGMTWENWINCDKYDISSPKGTICIKDVLGNGDMHVNIGGSSYFYSLELPDKSRYCSPTDIIEEGATYTARGEK